jgi:hypothetical protein
MLLWEQDRLWFVIRFRICLFYVTEQLYFIKNVEDRAVMNVDSLQIP